MEINLSSTSLRKSSNFKFLLLGETECTSLLTLQLKHNRTKARNHERKQMDPIVAKMVIDLGIAFTCGAVVISLFILLFKRFLSNSATDRTSLLSALQRQLDLQQGQIAELRRDVRKMREDKDVWFRQLLEQFARSNDALMGIIEMGRYCQNGRQGPAPKGPSESDCFPAEYCNTCSTTASNQAVEAKDE